jgi:hypothetical protein
MSYVVDFQDVSTAGLESSPVAERLAGLRGSYFVIKGEH